MIFLRLLAIGTFVIVAWACSSSSPSEPAPSHPEPPEPVIDEAQAEEPAEPEAVAFERFVLVGNETPCPAQARGDCASRAELLADGTLRLDPWGEPDSPTLSAQVSETELREAEGALTDPELLRLLALPQVCASANPSENLLVRLGGVDHENMSGHCNELVIQAARGAIIDLASAHFPEHSLVSPPF